MQIAPLIHSRTFEADFNSKFAVRPEDFTDRDIEWVRKKILPSTQDLDVLNDVRLVAASNNGKCIAGVACILKLFADRNNLPSEVEEFYCDNRGRFVKVFLGYSIKDASPNEIPDITPADLIQLFKEYMADVWKCQAPETVFAPYRDVVAKNLVPNPPKPAQIFQGVELYEMSSAVNDKLFETYLALALKQSSLAFCTNLDRIQPIEDGIYQAVTTTANIISRLREKQRQIEEAEAAKKKSELERQRASYRVGTSAIYADKEIVSIDECRRRLDAVIADIILVDDKMNYFEPKSFEFESTWAKKFTCEVKKIDGECF